MKSEAVFRRCSVKEVFLKISKDYQLKISVSESRESGKGDFLWILRNFGNIYFVEHLWTHTFVKWSNEKLFWHKYIHKNHGWSCPLKYSCRFEGLQHGCLQFYFKGNQSQILSCQTYEVLQSFSFTQHYLLLGNCF